ncbi:UNVERIFIED_CONTAM: hypothetical protein PYX00_003789 [Menopon gallinae]|uniref:DUF7153 domain-containing protein n=1 Tax=Menopon gallinae TaxID=328185 RepID=A0AAW2I1P7_9NEOP
MNIMFRKNFHAEKERSYGKPSGHGRQKGKRNRDSGYTVMEEHHYRTHIFLSPTGSCLQQASHENEREQMTTSAKPSVALMKWAVGGNNNTNRRKRSDTIPETPTPTASRQVSFRSGKEEPGAFADSGHPAAFAEKPVRAEPITLATLDRDCFIIPVASLDRFLPAGVPMPFTDKQPSQLNVLEVDDPKQCVMIHLMTLMEPIEPLLESPLAKPLAQQRGAASELLAEIGQTKTAVEGMLLSNIEKNAEFPFISYYVINKGQHDPAEFFRSLRQSTLQKFDPKSMRYTAHHTLDLFNEVATIARPPLQAGSRRPQSKTTGYIISVYKVFEGDDGEKFEKNWLYWTGARMLYRYLPKSVGLRRITLHKSLSSGDKMYLLLCECSNFLEDLSAAALLIPALRGRLCGYTGLYRTSASF